MKYILEIETKTCILLSEHSKSKQGLEEAFSRVENYLKNDENILARIIVSGSEELVWDLGQRIN